MTNDPSTAGKTVVVPSEPTEAMIEAAIHAERSPATRAATNTFDRQMQLMADMLRAGIAAAPSVGTDPVHFQWNDGWKLWEQVVPEAAGQPGVVAFYPCPAPVQSPAVTREDLIELFDGNDAYRANVMDENRIWLSGILADQVLALFTPDTESGR